MKWLGIIGLAVFIYLLTKTDLKTLWQTIKQIDILWIIPAIYFFAITIIINAARWKYIVNKMGIGLSLFDASIITFKSLFAEHSPGKMGEIFVRSAYLKKQSKTSWSKAVFSSAFSRFVDIWVTAMEGIVAVLILIFLFGVKSSVAIPIIGLLVFVILIYFLIKNDRIMKNVLKPIYKLIMPKKFKGNFDRNFKNFYSGFKSINKKVIFVSLLYDLVALLTMAISFYFLGLSLGVKIPIYLALLAEPLLTVAVALPISFSGLGVREAVFTFIFSLIGESVITAIIFSLLFFALRTFMMIPGIVFILFEKKERKNLGALSSKKI